MKKEQSKKTEKPFPESAHAKKQVKLKVKRSSAGLGLFTREPIKKGTYIIEYIGEKVTADEANNRGGMYLFEINNRWTIDGSARKNTARYINHSCRPNCEIDIKKHRIMVMAKRNIQAGEELTYDYGTEFFKEYIKKNGCRCVKCTPKPVTV